jgi:DNA topoisomerase-3
MKTVGRFSRDPKLRRILRESAGIGTPATRSTILETLLARKFIVRKGRRLESTVCGEALVDWLPHWMTSAETTAACKVCAWPLPASTSVLFSRFVIFWLSGVRQ